jgi:hypothetical protein
MPRVDSTLRADSTSPSQTDRRSFGSRSMADLVPSVARYAFKRSAPSIVQLLEAWPSVVGPSLADVTTPVRLTQGTLTINCSGPMAMELQHLSGEVMERINRYLGRCIVKRLRFLQTTAIAPSPPTRQRSARTIRNVEAVESMPDGPLRDALRSLATSVLD